MPKKLNNSNSSRELDSNSIDKFGPLKNNALPLANRKVITKEKTDKVSKLLDSPTRNIIKKFKR